MAESSDQRFHELEQRYLALKKEYDLSIIERDSAVGKASALQLTLDDSNSKALSNERELHACRLELLQKEGSINELTSIDVDQRKKISYISEECENLKDERKQQVEEVSVLQKKLRELQSSLSTAENAQLPVQFELTKAIREKDSLVQQVQWLEQELSAKTAEFANQRQQLSAKNHALEASLTTETADNASKTQQIITLQSRIATQDQKIDSYMSKIGDLEHSLTVQRNNASMELDSQKKLTELYKKNLEETVLVVSELEEKHDSLLVQLEASAVAHAAALKEQNSQAEDRFNEMKQSLDAKITELESQHSYMGMGLSASAVAAAAGGGGAGQLDPSSRGLSSFTSLFDRVAVAEKEANLLKSKNRELETHLTRILKDIERKAPQIASLKSDYHRVLESNATLSSRLDLLVTENSKLKEQAVMDADVLQQCEADVKTLRQSNHDMAQQLQHLLKIDIERTTGITGMSRQVIDDDSMETDNGGSMGMNAGSDSTGALSVQLLLYSNVGELQSQNEHLLSMVRKLSSNPIVNTDPIRVAGADSALAQSHREAQAQLAQLKEQRQQREDMVAQLMQQRDMYRSLYEDVQKGHALTTGDSLSLAGSVTTTPMRMLSNDSSSASGTPAGDRNSAAVGSQALASAQIENLEAQISDLKASLAAVTKKLDRSTDAEQALQEAVDKHKNDLYALRVEYNKSLGDVRHHAERYERLEQTVLTTQQNLTAVSDRRTQLEGMVISQQTECRLKEEKILELRDANLRLEEESRRREIDLQVTKAAESRGMTTITELREELKRQASLLDSVHRIEMGLSARMASETEQLREDNAELVRVSAELRKELQDKNILHEGRVLQLEEELKTVRAKLEAKEGEFGSAREETVRSSAMFQALKDRTELLERQLEASNDRMLQLSASGVSNAAGASIAVGSASAANDMEVDGSSSLSSQTLQSKDLLLERAQSEVESLRSQLEVTTAHMEEFKNISVATEAMCSEVRSAAEQSKSQLEAELMESRKEAEGLLSQLNEGRSSQQTSIMELESLKDELKSSAATHAQLTRELNNKLDAAEAEKSQLAARLETLSADYTNMSSQFTAAQDNYRREVQMHSATAAQVDTLQASLNVTRTELHTCKDKLANMSATVLQLENQVTEYKASLDTVEKASSGRLAELTQTNNSLLDQVQVLAAQVEKYQSSRVGFFSQSTQSITQSQSQSQSQFQASTQDQNLDVGPSSQGVELNSEEVAALRKSHSDLREVLQYMKKEREMLEAKLAVAESERNRLTSHLELTQKNLDEMRAQARSLSSDGGNGSAQKTHSEEEYAKILAEVTQINIVRESNAHLRADNELLTKKLENYQQQLSTLNASIIPLQESVASLTHEKKRLETEQVGYVEDAAYWKNRLHTLVSRYNDVDPEEFRLLQVKCEELTAQLTAKEESYKSLQLELLQVQQDLLKLQDSATEKEAKLVASLQAESATRAAAAKTEYENNLARLRKELDSGKKTVGESVRLQALIKSNNELLAKKDAEISSLVADKEKAVTQSDKLRTILRAKIALLDDSSKKQSELTADNEKLKQSVQEMSESLTAAGATPNKAVTITPAEQQALTPAAAAVLETPAAVAATTVTANPVTDAMEEDVAAAASSTTNAEVPKPVVAAGSGEITPASTAPAPTAPAPQSSAPAPASTAPAPQSSAPAPQSSAPAVHTMPTQALEGAKKCKAFYLTGKCKFGSKCRFQHQTPIAPTPTSVAAPPPPPPPTTTAPPAAKESTLSVSAAAFTPAPAVPEPIVSEEIVAPAAEQTGASRKRKADDTETDTVTDTVPSTALTTAAAPFAPAATPSAAKKQALSSVDTSAAPVPAPVTVVTTAAAPAPASAPAPTSASEKLAKMKQMREQLLLKKQQHQSAKATAAAATSATVTPAAETSAPAPALVVTAQVEPDVATEASRVDAAADSVETEAATETAAADTTDTNSMAVDAESSEQTESDVDADAVVGGTVTSEDTKVKTTTSNVFLNLRPPSPVPPAKTGDEDAQGSGSATKITFGKSNSASTLFGSTGNATATGGTSGGFFFGNANAAPATGGGLTFGSGASAFGNTSSTAPVGGLFGFSSSAGPGGALPTTGLFGGVIKPGGLFGSSSSASNSTAAAPGGSAFFGAAAKGGIFGSAKPAPALGTAAATGNDTANATSATSIFSKGASSQLKLNIDPPFSSGNNGDVGSVKLLDSSTNGGGGTPRPFSISQGFGGGNGEVTGVGATPHTSPVPVPVPDSEGDMDADTAEVEENEAEDEQSNENDDDEKEEEEEKETATAVSVLDGPVGSSAVSTPARAMTIEEKKVLRAKKFGTMPNNK